MTQFYSDQTREDDTYSLPDCEVFFVDSVDENQPDPDDPDKDLGPGWYYWFCFPGCMPDSDPIGPFESPQEAIDDCRENWGME